MQKEGIFRYGSGAVGNYDVYLTLEEGASLEVVLHSSLDDGISSASLTNKNMPPSCKNLFENIDDFFQHFAHLLQKGSADLLAVSDIGEVRIGEMMERKGKEVRVECAFQCEKVPEHLFNRFYLRIIRQLKQERTQGTSAETKKEAGSTMEAKKEGGRLFLSVEMINNPFISCFNKFQEEVQIQDYVKTRIKLFFHQTIPKGFSFITLKIITLKNNAFALGIIDQDENKQISKSPYSICYEFRTGEMKDTNNDRGKAEAHWRRGAGLGIADLKNAVVRMEVNTTEQSLRFFCNGHLVGETVISNYLMSRRMSPYVSCKHQGDRFQLNP